MDLDSLPLAEIWKEIEKKAQEHPEYVESLKATYVVNLTGDEIATYGLIFDQKTTKVVEGEVENADCTLSMSVKSFKKLLQGNLNTTTAFMTGKLKVKGNISFAIKLEGILKKFSF